MLNWDLRGRALTPNQPEILSSTEDARAILLEVPAGNRLSDHEVHERALASSYAAEALSCTWVARR